MPSTSNPEVLFEPVCYDHAAALAGISPWQMSRDADLLAQAHLLAIDSYGYQRCVVGVDIYNIEIEAYGCEVLQPSGSGVPTAGEPPFESPDELLDLQLDLSAGRFGLILAAAEKVRSARPQVKVGIPLAGPFTIASHLIGLENMICELFSDPDPAIAALQHLARNEIAYGKAAIDAGFGIALFESSVTPPLLSPDLFRVGILPALREMIAALPSANEALPLQLIIGGNTLPILDAMLETGAGCLIAPFEAEQAAFAKALPATGGPAVRFNMNPAVFLPGSGSAAIKEAERLYSLASQCERGSVGCLIPYEADPAIVKQVAEWFQVNNGD
jgi:uroporphyrinogen-III decarboxylase